VKELARRLKSFRFAYEGIKYALTTQPNMKIHFFISFVTLISALFFRLPVLHILFILLAITLMIVTELLNTAVEKTVDLAMPDSHPIAKIAKDVAAAAVLVAAVFAVAVGMIVFYDPVDRWFHGNGGGGQTFTPAAVWIYFSLVALTVVVAETRFSKNRMIRPSLWTAAAFAISTLIALQVTETLAALLSYALSILFLMMLYRRKGRTLLGLFLGAVLGVAITVLAFLLHMLN
jgi:diacylglycerol kinase